MDYSPDIVFVVFLIPPNLLFIPPLPRRGGVDLFRNFRNTTEQIYFIINDEIAKEGGLEEADVAIM